MKNMHQLTSLCKTKRPFKNIDPTAPQQKYKKNIVLYIIIINTNFKF